MRQIILATILSIVTLTTAAEARPRQHHPAGWIDVAAIPAYPMERSYRQNRAARTASHRVKQPRMRLDAQPAEISHQRASLQVDKSQEYVKPSSPDEKLVTRETYEQGGGIVRSHKTGATARVSPRYAAKFQAFINELEAGGAAIKFMGGIRRGSCWQGSKHPCGMALDYCQYARGVVDRRCNLPGRARVAQIAARHGLFEGGQWCNHDYGHVEAGGSSPCGRNLWSAVSKFKAKRHQQKDDQRGSTFKPPPCPVLSGLCRG